MPTLNEDIPAATSDDELRQSNARFAFSSTNLSHPRSDSGAAYGTFRDNLDNSQSLPDVARERQFRSFDLSELRSKPRKSVDISPIIAPPYLFPSVNELKECEKEEKDPPPPPLTKRQILCAISLALVNFCATAVFGCIAPFFPAEAQSKGTSSTLVGLIFGIFEFCVFVFSPIAGRMVPKIGAKFTYTIGLFITGSTNILFGLLNKSPPGSTFTGLCFAVRIIEAIGDSMFLTASFSITAKEFPGRISTMIGLLETFSGLGFTAGPAIGGVLYQAGGFGLPFFVLGALLLAAAAVSIVLIPQQKDFEAQSPGGFLRLMRIT